MRNIHAAGDNAANEAMARYRAGVPSGFDDLCCSVAPRLRAFFLRRTGDSFAADDLVQETLLRLYRGRDRFDRGGAVMPLVFTIARRLLIDRGRR